MIKNILVIPFTLIFLLAGCNNDNKTETSKYSGIWYFEETDTFLEIQNNNAVAYECSLNDGYIVDKEVNLSISGDKLIINSEGLEVEIIGHLKREEESLTIRYEKSDNLVTFFKKNEIPVTCSSDAIEISYVSPLNATIGVEQTYIVNFNYRYTGNSGYIDVGFITNEDGHMDYPYIEPFELSNPETNSGSIEVSFTANKLAEGTKFYMSVDLNRQDEEGDYESSVSDRVLIDLTN